MTSLEAESVSLREEVQHARLQSEENNRQVLYCTLLYCTLTHCWSHHIIPYRSALLLPPLSVFFVLRRSRNSNMNMYICSYVRDKRSCLSMLLKQRIFSMWIILLLFSSNLISKTILPHLPLNYLTTFLRPPLTYLLFSPFLFLFSIPLRY